MARKAKGKPLTLRPIRLDDDVWAECQRLGKLHGTINEGLRTRLLQSESPIPELKNTKEAMLYAQRNNIPTAIPVTSRSFKPPLLKPSEKKPKK